MTRETRNIPKTNYPVPKKRSIGDSRVIDEALAQSKGQKALIDVRSPANTKARSRTMPEYPQEGVLAAAATSRPRKACLGKPRRRMTGRQARAGAGKIYLDQCGVTPGTETIVYCRIGERSSPHLVCTHLSAWAQQRAQLRRLSWTDGQQSRRAY